MMSLVGALALTYGVASLASYALATNLPAVQSPKKLASEYLCNGVIDDKTYELTLAVRPLGDAYHVRWLRDEAVSMEGLAIESDGYLSVAIVSRSGIGVAIYKVDGPVLAGTWTGGDGRVYPEVCKRRAMGV